MNPEIREKVGALIGRAIEEAVGRGDLPPLAPPSLEVKIPTEKGHGDLTSTIAMRLAAAVRRPPAEIASRLAEFIRSRLPADLVSAVEADPRQGFLNFTLAAPVLQNALKAVFPAAGRWGESGSGKGKRALLEFVSANPTGSLTVAHGRQAAVGDVLSNLMAKAGFEVTREYYLNDRGRQMHILGRSLYLRWKELRGEKIEIPEDHYRGDYLIDLARKIPPGPLPKLGKSLAECSEEEARGFCTEFAMQDLLALNKSELNEFRVPMDNWVSEREIVASGKVAAALDRLAARGDVYQQDDALWFRSTAYGDEKDRVLKKSGGELTYFASDIAYHLGKFERGYDLLVDLWGPDHHGHIVRMKGALKALGSDPGRLQVIIVQIVKLFQGREEVRMSTRAGQFVSLREIMREVGTDAARYFFVRRRKESPLDFDLELAKKRSLENPVYYVQYAHARISNILKRYRAAGKGEIADFRRVDLEPLKLPEELEIVKKILIFPELAAGAALAFQPHLVPTYLEELAGLFHGYYNRHRVIVKSPSLARARLALAWAAKSVLAEGLAILGVSAPEKM